MSAIRSMTSNESKMTKFNVHLHKQKRDKIKKVIVNIIIIKIIKKIQNILII